VFRSYQISGTLKLPSTVISGVPQGCELGLQFFYAFVNDVCSAVTHSTFFLFADDTQFFRAVILYDDYSQSQSYNDSMYGSCAANFVAISAGKTFSRKSNILFFEFLCYS
jgi:hypothetical protein